MTCWPDDESDVTSTQVQRPRAASTRMSLRQGVRQKCDWHKSAFVAHHQKNRHPKAPAILFKFMNECSGIRCSGTGVQHSDGAAILRPARDVVTDRDRAFLAVGDGPHPARIDTARGEGGD